jgi:hypothetical protein|tara:strand:- start:6857 stop:7462 length:606 start_codon:yes stop_codon:yes gene_type:complete
MTNSIFNDESIIGVDGYIKIWDPNSGDIFVNQHNAVHPENMSIAIAGNLVGSSTNTIYEMHFGNGGTTVSGAGVVTYKSPNVNVTTDDLYNKTYFKVIDETDTVNNLDPTNNKREISHVAGTTYSDIITTCTLDYAEPTGQDVLDNSTDMEGTYIFDELGLKSKAATLGAGLLLTHVIFHPVQKSANRLIQVVYTLRIRVG